MKKFILSAVIIVAFSASSAFAGPCNGCGDKDKTDKKEGEKKTAVTHFTL